MPYINRSTVDGRYVGQASVDSAGAWTDVAVTDYASSTSEAIPNTARLVDVFAYNESDTAPLYILCRAHGTKADDDYSGALIVPALSGRGVGLNIPDAPITTISINGVGRVEMVGV